MHPLKKLNLSRIYTAKVDNFLDEIGIESLKTLLSKGYFNSVEELDISCISFLIKVNKLDDKSLESIIDLITSTIIRDIKYLNLQGKQ